MLAVQSLLAVVEKMHEKEAQDLSLREDTPPRRTILNLDEMTGQLAMGPWTITSVRAVVVMKLNCHQQVLATTDQLTEIEQRLMIDPRSNLLKLYPETWVSIMDV